MLPEYLDRLTRAIEHGVEPQRRPQHARALQASLNADTPADQPPSGSWLARLGIKGW